MELACAVLEISPFTYYAAKKREENLAHPHRSPTASGLPAWTTSPILLMTCDS